MLSGAMRSLMVDKLEVCLQQLEALFHELGISDADRATREKQLHEAIEDTLQSQVKTLTAQRDATETQCHTLDEELRSMEKALGEVAPSSRPCPPWLTSLQRLQQEKKHLNSRFQQRRETASGLYHRLEVASRLLDPDFTSVVIPSHSVPWDLTVSSIHALGKEVERCESEMETRERLARTFCTEIVQYWAELGSDPAEIDRDILENYQKNVRCLGLQTKTLVYLQGLRDELAQIKEERRRQLDAMSAEISSLWRKLDIPEEERRKFLASHCGCSREVLDAFADELGRLDALKRANAHVFVRHARDELLQLWQELFFSEAETQQFTPAFAEVTNDACLAAHEHEIARLQELSKERQPVLQLVHKHHSLLDEQLELHLSSQDASRLLLRGPQRHDPSRLLREEKMRKKIARELPRTETALHIAILVWEEQHHEPFLVHGKRYLDVLDSQSREKPAVPSVGVGGKSNSSVRPKPLAPVSINGVRGSPVRSPIKCTMRTPKRPAPPCTPTRHAKTPGRSFTTPCIARTPSNRSTAALASRHPGSRTLNHAHTREKTPLVQRHNKPPPLLHPLPGKQPLHHSSHSSHSSSPSTDSSIFEEDVPHRRQLSQSMSLGPPEPLDRSSLHPQSSVRSLHVRSEDCESYND